MYTPDTILELKEQKFIDAEGRARPLSEFKGKKDEEPTLFPYNRVKVIGQSPIDHGHSGQGWQGTDAYGVIIQPISDFAANLDEPLGKLNRLYNVAIEPDDDEVPNVVASDRGFNQVPASRRVLPTPEEILRGERDPYDTHMPARPSGNTLTTSPLDEVDPGDPATAPVLPDVEPPAAPVEASTSPLD